MATSRRKARACCCRGCAVMRAILCSEGFEVLGLGFCAGAAAGGEYIAVSADFFEAGAFAEAGDVFVAVGVSMSRVVCVCDAGDVVFGLRWWFALGSHYVFLSLFAWGRCRLASGRGVLGEAGAIAVTLLRKYSICLFMRKGRTIYRSALRASAAQSCIPSEILVRIGWNDYD